jgi:hypothetical protein
MKVPVFEVVVFWASEVGPMMVGLEKESVFLVLRTVANLMMSEWMLFVLSPLIQIFV